MAEKPSLEIGQVMENRGVAPGHFLLTIRLPLSFCDADPGAVRDDP